MIDTEYYILPIKSFHILPQPILLSPHHSTPPQNTTISQTLPHPRASKFWQKRLIDGNSFLLMPRNLIPHLELALNKIHNIDKVETKTTKKIEFKIIS